MAYPTGFEQLLDAVRSWEAPYFKQRELGEQKAAREGAMQLELAKLDLANKQAIVDNALKRAQIPLLKTQNEKVKVDLEEAKQRLADLQRELQDQHDLTRAQINNLNKRAEAAMRNAIGSGALTAKEKKIADFTSRIMLAGQEAISVADSGDWDKFSKWWVKQNLPPKALAEIKPYFNAIVSSDYSSPARDQFRNFILSSLYDPMLTSSGLQDRDIPDWTKRQLLRPYSFEGISTQPEPIKKTSGGFLSNLFGNIASYGEKPPVGKPEQSQAVALPGRNVQRGGRGVAVNKLAPASNNLYGSGNMLAEGSKPAGATGEFNVAPMEQASTGLEVLQPTTQSTGNQWEQVFYEGKLYLVNPQTNEVRTASGNKVILGKNKILQFYRTQSARGKQ